MKNNYHQWRIIGMAWFMYLIFVPLREETFDNFLARPNQVILIISIVYLLIIAGSMRWPVLHFVIVTLLAIYPFGKMVEFQIGQVIKLSQNYGQIVIILFGFLFVLYLLVAYIYQSKKIRESVQSDPKKFGISSNHKGMSLDYWIYSDNQEGQKYNYSIMLISIIVRSLLRGADKSTTATFLDVITFVVILLLLNYIVANICFIVELVRLEKRNGRKLIISTDE